MISYNIVIYNESDVKVYDEIIVANNVKEAITILLDKIEVIAGDTIKIDEI